ncbi:MAG: hypothetical protein WB586_16850 [Chthoniobacterales bacterium]
MHKEPHRKLALLRSRMDFTHPDNAPSGLLNEILWKSVRGAQAKVPALRHGLGKAVASKPG